MKKQLLIKSFLIPLMCLLGTSSFATIDWVGNMFPVSGSSSDIAVGSSLDVYIQVYKAGVTNSGGQGAGITCEIYYGEVLSFGGVWQNTFTQSMSYNVDIGNNDEYQGSLTPLSEGLYEFTCRCSDDGGASWEFASLPSGNGQLTVLAPLPIELSSFTAQSSIDEIYLDWSTLSERNNEFFTIEKSVDGVEFKSIGTEDGKGNSHVRNDYQFIDENPQVGINYYRLKQTDFDGKYEYTDVISVKYEGKGSTHFFPNPAKEKLTIATKLEAAEIEIYNVNGQLVHISNQSIEGQLDIDLSTFQSGIYFLQMKNNFGKILFTDRFVKK